VGDLGAVSTVGSVCALVLLPFGDAQGAAQLPALGPLTDKPPFKATLSLRTAPPRHCGLIARIASDMTLPDDGVPAASVLSTIRQPERTGYNIHGVIASGKTALGARQLTKDLRTYRAVGPWITVSDEVGNPVANPTVQVGQPTVRYFSRRAGSYQSLSPTQPMTGAMCSPDVKIPTCQEVPVTAAQDSTQTVQIPTSHRFAGRFSAVTIDPKDIEFIFVTIPMRLIGAQSRQARVLARVGAQYHETAGILPFDPNAPHASAGVSRLRRLSTDWQTLHYASIINGGIQIPGSGQAISFLVKHSPSCAVDAQRVQ
jgi:hypothetical protein